MKNFPDSFISILFWGCFHVLYAQNQHDSLPNATYVGFTGTPVDGTIEVFGPVVDAYTMTAVSYTHLDVDKRQQVKTSSKSACPSVAGMMAWQRRTMGLSANRSATSSGVHS